MWKGPRRRVILGGASLLLSGCVGPTLRQDESDFVPAQSNDDASFDEATLSRIVAHAEDVSSHVADAAQDFERWQSDSTAIDVNEIDELRIESTDLLTRFWNHVLPHESNLRESSVAAEWDGDGPALADTLQAQEIMLVAIEDASIGIVNADGNPARTTASAHDAVEYVIAESGNLVEAIESALPN